MGSHQLTRDDIALAEKWLNDPSAPNDDIVRIFGLAMQHLKELMNKDLSRADLVKYLRLQMGIEPKSEKLKDQSPSKQFPGSAIFRR